jgi:hypothetical protein
MTLNLQFLYHVNSGIKGSNITQGTDAYLCFSVSFCPLEAEALQWADSPYKSLGVHSYRINPQKLKNKTLNFGKIWTEIKSG